MKGFWLNCFCTFMVLVVAVAWAQRVSAAVEIVADKYIHVCEPVVDQGICDCSSYCAKDDGSSRNCTDDNVSGGTPATGCECDCNKLKF